MNRRGFLKLGSAAVAGLIYDPDLLLWRPPKAMIVVPAMPVVRSVSFAQLVAATYDEVLKERSRDGHYFWSDTKIIRHIAETAHAELLKKQR